VTKPKPSAIGARIRRYRNQAGLNPSQLAAAADVSKSYLWSLENGQSEVRPSGETLYKIAKVLGVSMSDLLGRQILVKPPEGIPTSLRAFADEAKIPEADVRMLASIRFRGQRPQTKERWRYIYEAIRTSKTIDERD
jgi:transcriptional regulator with XRE-family HTH domain